MPTRKVAWKGKVKSREGAVGSCGVRLVEETQSGEDPVKYPQKHPSKHFVLSVATPWTVDCQALSIEFSR